MAAAGSSTAHRGAADERRAGEKGPLPRPPRVALRLSESRPKPQRCCCCCGWWWWGYPARRPRAEEGETLIAGTLARRAGKGGRGATPLPCDDWCCWPLLLCWLLNSAKAEGRRGVVARRSPVSPTSKPCGRTWPSCQPTERRRRDHASASAASASEKSASLAIERRETT